jgi:selenoprotein W-related protein
VSLEKDLLKEFEHLIESVTLIPSDGGRFEVTVNGTLIYSKLQTKRHAEPGEVVGLIGKMVENQ